MINQVREVRKIKNWKKTLTKI